MKKHRRNEHGAITVFLSFVLIFIIAFMGMLVDIARMRVSEAQIKRASQLALDSVMASYSRRLREDYGLYGYAGGDEAAMNEVFNQYFGANLQPAAQEEDGEFLTLMKTITGYEDVKYGDMLNLQNNTSASSGKGDYALRDPDVMFQQIMEFSKFRVPMHMALNNNVSDISKMQESLNQVTNDTKAYDRINDLGQPLQGYYDDRSELGKAVTKLNEAIAAYNSAADKWNSFVDGNSGEVISVSGSRNVSYPRAYFSEETTVNGIAVYSGVDSENDTDRIDYDASAVAYNYNQAVVAFHSKLRQQVLEQYQAYSLQDVVLTLGYQVDTVDKWYEEGQLDDEVYSILNEALEKASKEAMLVEAEAEVKANGEIPDIRSDMLNEYKEELEDKTKGYKKTYDDAVSALEDALEAVNDAVKELEDQRGTVTTTINSINRDISEMRSSNAISDGIMENWSGGTTDPSTGKTVKGEKEATEDTLEEDKVKIDELKTQLTNFADVLEQVHQQKDRFSNSQLAESFVSHVKNQQTWNGSNAHMPKVQFDGKFEADATDDKKNEYKNKKDAADKQNNEAIDELEKLKKTLDSHIQKYNKTEIPDTYSRYFLNVEAVQDDEKLEELNDDAEMSDVEGASKNKTGLMGKIAEKFSGGLAYVLGTVYCSEYILSMFSNAAPAQKDNHYEAKDFKFEKVITLRNAIPAGGEEYSNLLNSLSSDSNQEYTKVRLGYFYNAEVEYILFGKPLEKDNVDSAQIMLQVIFTAANYVQVRNNPTLKALVEAAAAAAAAIYIPMPLTRFILYTAFAFTETQFDLFYLMLGYKVPAFCTDGNKLFMMNLHDVNSILEMPGQFMINYEFYLRLRLMLQLLSDDGKAGMMTRLANLIQLNINYAADANVSGLQKYPSDGSFRMVNAFTTFKANASAKMPYWFMTMAMMGRTRSDSKYYQFPDYAITASY